MERTRIKYVKGRRIEEYRDGPKLRVHIDDKRVLMTYEEAIKHAKTMKPIPNKQHK